MEDCCPAWSPLGNKIAYESFATGNFDIWTINPDGTGATNITNRPPPAGKPAYLGYDGTPRWSPDGGTILYRAIRNAGRGFYRINADGSNADNPQVLVFNSGLGQIDRTPASSPDGQKLTFVSDRYGPNDIFIANADGTAPVDITPSPAGVSNFDPAWH